MRGRVLLGGLLVLGALAACGDDAPARDAAQDGGTVDVALAAELETGCPSWDADVPYPAGDLPLGATSVRLCPGKPIISADGRYDLAGIQGTEPLTTDVESLVEMFNELPSAPAEQYCTADGGPRLTYWFTYPDDRVAAVVFERFGCRSVLTGEQRPRVEGSRLAVAFSDALLAQRAGSAPPDLDPAQPACRDLTTSPMTTLPVAMTDVARATVCFGAGTWRVEEVPLTAAELDRFREAVAAAPETTLDEAPCPGDGGLRFATVMVVTVWGDLAQLHLDGCGRIFLPRDPRQATGAAVDTPVRLRTDELQTLLDGLGPGPVVRYDSSEGRTTPPEQPG